MKSQIAANRKTIALLGGSQHTSNLGVSALGLAAIQGIEGAFPGCRILLHDWSMLHDQTPGDQENTSHVELLRLHSNGPVWDRRSILNYKWLSRASNKLPNPIGGQLTRLNRAICDLRESHAVIDISAGDSFSDIYGTRIFDTQMKLKELVLTLGIPLVLAPQTYGPFNDNDCIERAKNVLLGASLIVTREAEGQTELRRTFGDEVADKASIRPDMALLLRPRHVPPNREPAISTARKIVGINISGMLFFSTRNFGISLDYKKLMSDLIQWIIESFDHRVVLFPHVLSEEPDPGALQAAGTTGEVNDSVACATLMDTLGPKYGDRLTCIGHGYNAPETKFLIGHSDFFIGARMHACVAAISQRIPTVTLAYSKKAKGLLSLIGISDTVVDLREAEQQAVFLKIQHLFHSQASIKETFNSAIPDATARANHFFTQDLHALLHDQSN
ncbi:colanic acid biosynthesis protein [Roseimaritima multifibrata]|uniref:Colanic acid biosynthesis protein n=1 Tax=Roseimaritima multifibrata TaxID=1930274 RepID=A0A517MMG8_9BACT|nr:polysaccharide pyruvyl transferase family protein [Roseimaritima multifibrata]QDS96076.1 colanic acid biosynthesis protein [Roseimaritima multifibrata]